MKHNRTMAFNQINLIIVALFCILGCAQIAAEGSIVIDLPWATDIDNDEACSRIEDKIIRDIVELVAIIDGNGGKVNNSQGQGQGRRNLRKVGGPPLTRHRQEELVAYANDLCENSSIGCIDMREYCSHCTSSLRKLDQRCS